MKRKRTPLLWTDTGNTWNCYNYTVAFDTFNCRICANEIDCFHLIIKQRIIDTCGYRDGLRMDWLDSSWVAATCARAYLHSKDTLEGQSKIDTLYFFIQNVKFHHLYFLNVHYHIFFDKFEHSLDNIALTVINAVFPSQEKKATLASSARYLFTWADLAMSSLKSIGFEENLCRIGLPCGVCCHQSRAKAISSPRCDESSLYAHCHGKTDKQPLQRISVHWCRMLLV